MVKPGSWMAALLAVAICGVVVGVAEFASQRVHNLLDPVARGVPPEPAFFSGWSWMQPATFGEESAPGVDTGGPTLDLEHPSERDWRFLLKVLETGSREARRSATRALLLVGGMRGVEPLLRQVAPEETDSSLFCLVALDILRLQRQEEALASMIQVLADDSYTLTVSCRSEISDRFKLVGGRDPAAVASLARHDDAVVRGFVASYLGSLEDDEYDDLLAELALDSDPVVQARAKQALGLSSVSDP